MSIFDKFDEAIDQEELQAAVEEAEKNGGSGHSEVPDGTYIVKMEKIELGQTKDGRPMLKVMARILEGEYKKHCLFMNRVIYGTKNDGNMIASAIGFLKTLEAEDEDGNLYPCTFKNYSQFADLCLDIAEAIDEMGLVYEVEYEAKAFNCISVKGVLEE